VLVELAVGDAYGAGFEYATADFVRMHNDLSGYHAHPRHAIAPGCYPADAALTGVELSPAMLAVARQYAADLGREVDLHEGDAERLPFGDASFDTVVCALALCTIPDPAGAIGEMRRVLVPGGRLLLLDHIGSSWPPIYAAQWLLERFTIRAAGEYFTRRQLPLVQAAGFEVVASERLNAGSVERIAGRKPASSAG